MKLFHVTPTSNLKSIMSKGLLPKVGYRSRIAKESIPSIYFFSTLSDVSNGLNNWFGELFEEEIRLSLLQVDVPDHLACDVDSCGWEKNVLVAIRPENIKILSKDVMNTNEVDI